MKSILILEDNDGRIRDMTHQLSTLTVNTFGPYKTAPLALASLELHFDSLSLVCLDHDLESERGDPDPGDGRDVVRWLCTKKPSFPILIHTSNSRCGEQMELDLKDNKWPCHWVPPYNGNEWIEKSWIKWVRKYLEIPDP